jgi:hypothetical protein
MTPPSAIPRPAILVITDSLGFPRATPEVVLYHESYIARLQAAFPNFDIVHFGHGGATIEQLFKYTSYYHQTLRPDLCFIQSGIVDCAPRALTEIELQIVKRVPLLGNWIGRLVQRNARTIRRIRKLYYTPIDKYSRYVSDFEDTFGRVYWITMPIPSKEYEVITPGITDQVIKYNNVLRRRNHITTDDFCEGDMMSDHHHLSVEGHGKIFEKISQIIRDVATLENPQ